MGREAHVLETFRVGAGSRVKKELSQGASMVSVTGTWCLDAVRIWRPACALVS